MILRSFTYINDALTKKFNRNLGGIKFLSKHICCCKLAEYKWDFVTGWNEKMDRKRWRDLVIAVKGVREESIIM